MAKTSLKGAATTKPSAVGPTSMTLRKVPIAGKPRLRPTREPLRTSKNHGEQHLFFLFSIVVWSKQHILRFFCKCWFDEANSVSVFFNEVLWNQLREWSATLVSKTGRIYTSKTSRLVDWSYEFSFSSDKETNGIWATSIEHEKWSREGRVQLGRLFSKCAKRMLLVLKPLNLSQAATPTSRFWAALSNSTTTCDPKIHKAPAAQRNWV